MSDDTLPNSHTAGDSTDWRLDAGEYLPTAGWTAKLILLGAGAPISIDCSAVGASFAVQKSSADTASWPAGKYTARLLYLKDGARRSRDLSALRVLPDPAAGGTTAASLLTEAERHLADLEGAYRDHMASGNAVVAEYRIGHRMKRFKDVADLLRAITAARAAVDSEKAAAGLAAGVSARKRFVTRM